MGTGIKGIKASTRSSTNSSSMDHSSTVRRKGRTRTLLRSKIRPTRLRPRMASIHKDTSSLHSSSSLHHNLRSRLGLATLLARLLIPATTVARRITGQ